jgi:hypothetical protein
VELLCFAGDHDDYDWEGNARLAAPSATASAPSDAGLTVRAFIMDAGSRRVSSV